MRRGQALVEFAIVAPVLMFMILAVAEVALLMAAKTTQDGATLELARWSAVHPDDDGAALFGLDDCDVTTTPDTDAGTVTVHATCEYAPLALRGFWDGLDIGSEAVAATPSPTP